VPLIIHLPGQRRGRRIGGQVRLMDIMPTVLDYLGLSATNKLDGQSLMPVLNGEVEEVSLDLHAEALSGYYELSLPPLYATSDARYKYILHAKPELYDRYYDKREARNVSADAPKQASRLKERVLSFLKRPSGVQNVSRPDTQTTEKLRSLGYLMSTGPKEISEGEETEFDVDYEAMKRTIQTLIEARARIMVADREVDVEAELARLVEVREQLGDMPMVIGAMAEGNVRLHRYAEAERFYLRLLELSGRDPNELVRFVYFLARQKRYKEAITILEEARQANEDLDRHDPDVYYLLARAHLAVGEKETARRYFTQGKKLDPDNHIGDMLRRLFAQEKK